MFGTAAGNGPIVQPPDYTRVNVEQRWNDINRGTEGLCERPVPVSRSSKSLTLADLGTNLGLLGQKRATNPLGVLRST